ncbi:diguanylate cyclase (GGDEF)-like protein [Oceanisphaera litoralis]|uniref:GGDEF domain-containing protein n=1 Tax=Oceanisphaera litoralis TaxID=225144 RepID=UPI00195E36C2|nr:GGDEF domain-containing protein [Oceanisphaera litoralis]MBM7454305.1 diguanylate cyclase (GGDEF)-like protein [Oceanisphaera litoralis]
MELKEYWSDSDHSRDFKLIRIGVVAVRFRWLVALLIIGIAGWIAVDWWVLDPAQFKLLWKARLITGVMLTPLLPLSYLCKLDRRWMVMSLYTLLGILLLFNFVSLWSFRDGVPIPVGYLAFPYFLLALLAALPLPIRFGLRVAVVVILAVLGTDYWLDDRTLDNGELIDRIWLLLCFSLTMIWVQAGQLRMLLDLYRESTRDPLTRLMNRRLFLRQLEAVRHDSGAGQPYTLILLDLDKFKRLNDDHGHLMGDEVLVSVATTIMDIFGQQAIAARYGGEEFMVLLPETRLDQGVRQAETLRLAVESQPVESPLDESEVMVTLSAGVVEGHHDSATSEVLRLADEALYRAKSRGRNCVVAHP